MTKAKEKAKELVKMFGEIDMYVDTEPSIKKFKLEQFDIAAECAKIAVKQIIATEPRFPSYVDWDDCGSVHKYYYEEQRDEANKFWNNVLIELNKIM